MDGPGCFVGIDMGTTNTRAWLVAGDRIVSRARSAVGVRDTAVSGSAAAVRTAVGDLVARLAETARRDEGLAPECVIAAGMVTSALGLAEVPHVPAPAGAAELAGGAQRHRFEELAGLDAWLLPGVRTGPPTLDAAQIGAADVMRGEETLCVGLIVDGMLPVGARLLNLGSHWKTIRIDGEGRIAGSSTSLSGELLHAAQTRTILSGSVPPDRPERISWAFFRAGMAEAERSGLARALFCVRLLEQRTRSDPAERLSFLAGAFVGAEIGAGGWGREEAGPVVIAGGEALAAAVTAAFRERNREAAVLSPAQVEAAMLRGLRLVGGAAIAARG
jgi:2-dehydro-3-deoxygalactonokinase